MLLAEILWIQKTFFLSVGLKYTQVPLAAPVSLSTRGEILVGSW